MKKTVLFLLALFVCVCFGVTIALAQEAEKPAQGAPEGKAAAAKDVVKAETLSGTLSMVDKEKKFVVLVGSSGVPYNFKVSGATRIKVAGKKAKLDDLAGQTNKTASIKFLPLRSGNVAQMIEVTQ